jgi:hypothetical protein
MDRSTYDADEKLPPRSSSSRAVRRPQPAGRHREQAPTGAIGAAPPRWPQRQPGTHLPPEAYEGRHRGTDPTSYQQLSRLLAALKRL